MLKYLIKDLAEALQYLPYGIGAGIVVLLLLTMINRRRVRANRTPFCVVSTTALLMYMFIILCITFLSRESGSRIGFDMEFLSTWGINDRNNAYVIENVLLFIPYGILVPWVFRRSRNFFSSFLIGITTSLTVECLQLITSRGYFQIDDILTNTLGAVIGYFVFKLISGIKRK